MGRDYRQLPGIVRVSSTYVDLASDQSGLQRVEGSGFVIDVPELRPQKVVITAAHVASGDVQPTADNVTVSWFDPAQNAFRDTKVQFRFLLSGMDVAAMLVDAPDMPAMATYAPTSTHLDSGANAAALRVKLEFATLYKRPGPASESFYRLGQQSYLPLIYDYLSAQLSPIANLTEHDLDSIAASASPALAKMIRVGFDGGEFERTALVPFAPGMSGAPILSDRAADSANPQTNLIIGMAGADARYFTKSWIIPAQFIALGISQMITYVESQDHGGTVHLPWRYNIDRVFWRDFGGILFRQGSIPRLGIDYKELILDRDFARGEVGNGTRADVGNAEWIDGRLSETIRRLRPGTSFLHNNQGQAQALAFLARFSGTEALIAANSGGTQSLISMIGLQAQNDVEYADLSVKALVFDDAELVAAVWRNLKRRYSCEGEAVLLCRLKSEKILPLSEPKIDDVLMTATMSERLLQLSFTLSGRVFSVAIDFEERVEVTPAISTYRPVMALVPNAATNVAEVPLLDVEGLLFDAYDSSQTHTNLRYGGKDYWLYAK